MDVKIEATPMVAEAELVTGSCSAVQRFLFVAAALIERVASIFPSVLSLGGTSLSAVSPDNTYFTRGLRLGISA